MNSTGLLEEVKAGELPVHVGIIMDGNGRWARARGLPRGEGHRQGALAAERIVKFVARERLFPYLTLFAFSTENWSRPRDEVEFVFELLRDFLRTKAQELVEAGVRLWVIGDLDPLPAGLREAVEDLEERTAANEDLILSIALNFGGRWAICRAVQEILRAARSVAIDPAGVDESFLKAYLPTAGLPDLDLVIRTGGRLRLSNFLLWEVAYAELYFTDTLWPDFSEEDLLLALKDFQGRERSFGRVRDR
ncbi:MAG TPA: di-trans,poly-cis-decaprenylcistransferase [Candidatus Acetothermia bacterium]|nr:di-trans,poly-cis-decaprenylcistransferase [Candidatus Acetothermia bacterium]